MADARVVIGEGKILVGRLVFESDGRRSHSIFLYDQSWINHPRGFDLSPHMPRATAPYHAAAGRRDSRKREVIAGPFGDTAPDSWGRKLMRRVLETAPPSLISSWPAMTRPASKTEASTAN